VVAEGSYFLVLPVIADTNDWDERVLDELNELLYPSPVFITRHSVYLIHYDTVLHMTALALPCLYNIDILAFFIMSLFC